MEKKRILCFGDSNTWGFIGGLRTRYDEDTRWTGRLQNMLGSDYAVVEAGLSGRTTIYDNPLNPPANGFAHMKPILLSAAPVDLLIFMLGTNDFQTQIASTALNTALAVRYMLDEAKKMGADRPGEQMKILLMAPAAIDAIRLERKFPLDSIDETGIQSSRELGGYLKQVAEQMGYAFIDANDYIRPGEADGTHWDAEGHAKMADVIYEKVKELLG